MSALQDGARLAGTPTRGAEDDALRFFTFSGSAMEELSKAKTFLL
jgi:hypothetical protein